MIALQPKTSHITTDFRVRTADVRKFFLKQTDIEAALSVNEKSTAVRLTTTYFDTPDGRLFADQFRKTQRRFKIRSRKIGDGPPVLEVKVKGSLNPQRIWLAEPGMTLENGGREFIRNVIDTAFDPLFVRRIEQQLQEVATTSFDRASYVTEDQCHLFDFDTNVELSTQQSVAILKPQYTLLELSSVNNEKLVPAEWKPRKFSKFGATLDLLTGERVRSHKLGLLEKLFEVKQISQ
jgi:hypothetical protein